MDEDLAKLEVIVRDLFDEYTGPVTRALSARDVAQWDSLANVLFCVTVERNFGVKFSSSQVGKFKNVGELLDAVAAKRAGTK